MPPSPPLRFVCAHGTHPRAELALELVWAQLASQGVAEMQPTLGWVYLTDDLAAEASVVLAGLHHRLPNVAWVGAVGVGVLANEVEYADEPALVVMVCNLPAENFRLFHGRQPLPALSSWRHSGPLRELVGDKIGAWHTHTAQVHADGQTPDLPDLLAELAERTETGFLFGGLSAGRAANHVHLALDPHGADPMGQSAQTPDQGLWQGGLSGVAFDQRVRIVSRVTQGCEPVGPRREVTACERNIVYELDGQPALQCLLQDLGVNTTVTAPDWPRDALPRMRATLVGISEADEALMAHGAHFGADTRVRHLIGLDPARQGLAVSDMITPGMQLAFCQRHAQAARQDLIRICAEIREEFDPTDHPGRPPAGAIYISCAGRGGHHFGAPHAEMAIIAHALGDIPLVGFFAGGEIARHHLYGYTGILSVFGT